MNPRQRAAVTLGLVGLLAALTPAARTEEPRADDPGAWLARLREGAVATAGAVTVQGLTLPLGLGTLQLEQGHLFPVRDRAGAPLPELVFVGRGRLLATPPDEVEAGQLELFTGARQLDEEVTAAVLALGGATQHAELLASASAQPAEPSAASVAEAERLLADWRGSTERRLAGVEFGLLRAHGLGEAAFAPFRVAYVVTRRHAEVLLSHDPEAPEQLTLGRFVPLDLTAREVRKVRRAFHREQRRGRYLGLELGELGDFDHWLSASSRDPAGQEHLGASALEPTHYTVDVTMVDRGPHFALEGRCSVDLVAVAGGARAVLFQRAVESKIRAVRGATGNPLPFVERDREVLVVLPEELPAGATTRIEMTFSGPPFETAGPFADLRRVSRPLLYLGDTTGWHPHTGTVDRATYDVTVRAAEGFQVLAQGREVGQGRGWTRRVVERPTLGYSFEVGRFEKLTATAGDLTLELHLDETAREVFEIDGQELLTTAQKAVTFLRETFGPPPVSHLVLVTSGRSWSQSLLGYLTLSADMMSSRWRAGTWYDREPVLAHELAHQWWGHQADFRSYRDQWISEGMASYAAAITMRHRLGRLDPGMVDGTLFDWRVLLNLSMEDGRPLENAGPLVLGARLDSSRAPAYQPIVYTKGGLVLDLLGHLLAEGPYWRALAAILAEINGRPLTTEALIAGLERHTGQDLDALAERFLYGIGLPEVYYDYHFVPDPAGGWWVEGTMRQRAPKRYRYRVVRRAGGALDVAREVVSLHAIDGAAVLAVPVTVGVFDPRQPKPKGDVRTPRRHLEGRIERVGNWRIEGRSLLKGAEGKLRLHVDLEPRVVELDRLREVFAHFVNVTLEPKRGRWLEALDARTAGQPETAEAALREALTLPVSTRDPRGNAYLEELDTWNGRVLDARIHHELARLALDRGDLAAAAAALDAAENVKINNPPAAPARERRTLRARLALLQNDPQRTLSLLGDSWLREEIESREGLALAAVAAWQLGDKTRFAELEKETKGREIDLSILRPKEP